MFGVGAREEGSGVVVNEEECGLIIYIETI